MYVLQRSTIYFFGVYLACFAILPSIEADDHAYTTHEATSFQLNCTIQNYRYNSVTPRWSKKQLDDDEELLLFVDTRPQIAQKGDFSRYKASYVDQTNGFLYQLHINNTQPQDSGRYICDILDANGITVYWMNYTFNVIVPVQSVVLFKNYSESNMTFASSSDLPFYYADTISGSVGCQVIGGNPRPNVTVSVGSLATIPQSFIRVSRTWSGSKSGFKAPSWMIISYTQQFRVLPEYDGEEIVCTASIYDYNASSSNVILVNAVPYFYTNTCRSEQQAALGAVKAQISCRFHSHPAGQVTWTKAKTDVTQDYNSILDSDAIQTIVNLDGENDFVAKLIFSKVTENNFQTYKITVSNDFGSNSTIVGFSKSGHAANYNHCETLFITAFVTQAAVILSRIT